MSSSTPVSNGFSSSSVSIFISSSKPSSSSVISIPQSFTPVSSVTPLSSSITPISSSVVSSSSNQGFSSTISSSSVVAAGKCQNGKFTDSRNGKVYKCVTIGTQNWMAENLNYMPAMGNSWCYGNTVSNCTTYGRLYDWATTMALNTTCNITDCSDQIAPVHQGVCPTGWHIPTDAEWKTMEMYAGLTQTEADATGYRGTVGTKLKSTTGWSGTPGNGTDDFGFSALPAGYRGSNDSFSNLGISAYFWSASQSDAGTAWVRNLFGSSASLLRYSYGYGYPVKVNGFSVRCLQD